MTNHKADNIACFLVQQNEAGQCAGSMATITYDQYPPGELLVRPTLSSLNYKDALAATGHRGVIRSLPHIPGIDLAGTIVESSDSRFPAGSNILMMGSGFGSEKWGAWSRLVLLKADEAFALPPGLTEFQAMALGTAGFTAAQCIEALIAHDVTVDKGPILISGATGGVGSLATMMLTELGYEVACVTGKSDQHDWLRSIGASRIIDRQEMLTENTKPMLSAQWAGAVDTVGGDMLSTILKQTQPRGCVTACGMAGGNDLNTTVFPFILRGVTLVGIDSAGCPHDERVTLWQKIAKSYVPEKLNEIVTRVALPQIGPHIENMLAGRTSGRFVVDVQSD